ncbi:MAG: hypothetical protein KAU06_07600 [Candidatus Marinimicrobia bacterium]|nr:hypothetical protein [Candidatus Neomarinimicrobiota bacterium]
MDEQQSKELIETLKNINENLTYLRKIEFNLDQLVTTCNGAKMILDNWAKSPK